MGSLLEGLCGGLFYFWQVIDRVAVFVDAGYLFAQGSIELFGKLLPRVQMTLHAAGVTTRLREFAENISNLDLLRIYWYDATLTGPTQQHNDLAELSNLKVRLGTMNPQGQQRGVDALFVTDLITLARNGAMAPCLLLSGDEDLRIGVQLAQERGVRVHLLDI